MQRRQAKEQEMTRQNNTTPETDNITESLRLARSLAADGFAVFPCKPTKGPYTRHGFKDATTDLDRLTAWWRKWPDAIPGLPTGAVNGVAVVDLDTDPAKGKDGEAAARALGITREDSPFVVRTPSGGLHLYFKHRDGVTNTTGKTGLDVRGEGGYVIAPGAVGAQGAYKVAKGDLWEAVALDGLPRFPDALTRPQEAPQEAESKSTGEHTTADLWGPLAAIPSDLPYGEWVRVLMALHHATGGTKEGLDLAAAWSAKDYPEATRKEVADKWRSFRGKPKPVTADTLFAVAREHGWQVAGADDFDDLDDSGPDDLDTLLDEPDDLDALLGLAPPPDYGAGLTVLSPDDCANLPARDYVVKDLIAPGQIGCIFGEPGAGKSVIAPWLGYQIAQGGEFFGQRTKAGTVFYAAAEDERGMADRVTALHHQLGQADRFRLFQGVSDLFSKGEGRKQASPQLAALLKAVKAERPSLIVIDTLAMAMPGLEENDAEGMNRVVRIGKALAKHGAAVVFVHHGTKAEGDTPRGHSVFNGALDFSILVKADDQSGIVRGNVKKNRNGPGDLDIAFRIDSESVGLDVDGDPVTAPICHPVDRADHQPEAKLTPSQQAALDHLHELAGEAGESVPEELWRDASVNDRRVSTADKRASRRQAFQRAAKELVHKGQVAFADGAYRAKSLVEDEFDDL